MPMTHDTLVTLTAKIVSAYVIKHVIRGTELPGLIDDVHAALNGIGSEKPAVTDTKPEKPKPPVSIRKSIQDDYLICLEDGKQFKSMKRHLMSHYQMTPDDYRAKWGLPDDYPMVAPSYAVKRAQLARNNGLGRKSKAAS